MKKILFVTFLSLTLPVLAFASTVSFSPSSFSVTAGQMISVPVYVNSSGDTAYTVKVAISFPPELLEVRGFSFASSWLPLSQPGYDSTNNQAGSLIKTAGYARGLSSTANFGTVTFYAKSSGVATVSVGSGTQVLNRTNQNTFAGGGSASINIQSVKIITPTPTLTPVPKGTPANPVRKLLVPKNTPTSSSEKVATTSATAESVGSTTTEKQATSTQGAIAYYGEEFAARNVSMWASLVAVIASFVLGFFLAKRT